MKKRRFLRKALSPKLWLVYVLVIVVIILILSFAFGGIKAKSEGLDADNIQFNYSSGDWKSMLEAQAGDYDNNKWIAQNDKYVLYFDESTTIATLYVIEADALTGANKTYTKGTGETVSYPEVDITKCKVSYSTAKAGTDNNSNINIRVTDSSTGKLYGNGYSSYANSIQFKNKFTDSTESHFYLNYNVEDGLQILYEIGEFNAGENYFAKYIAASIYKPEEDAFLDKNGELREEDYNKAKDNWIKYMANFGVNDAWNAPYKEWMNAIASTFDERFRGNTIFYTNKDSEGVLNYTGNIAVYTKEAYEYFKAMVEDGTVTPKDGYEIEIVEKASVENYTNNCSWTFRNIDPEWLENSQQYFNTNESPLTHNYYLNDKVFENLKKAAYNLSNNNQLGDEFGDLQNYPYYLRGANLKGTLLSNCYSVLYTTSDTTMNMYKEKDGNLAGGFVKRNEDGTFVGEGENIERELYSLEYAALDNERFNFTSATSLPIVQVGLQFKLTDDGIKATVMKETLVDCQNAKDSDVIVVKNEVQEQKISDLNSLYVLYNIEVLPYMCYVDNNDYSALEAQKGSIIVPDGSGAIIKFDNGKTDMGATAVNKPYYGRDEAFVSKSVIEETQSLMLGMYGFILDKDENHPGGAILATIEKGGNQVTLYAQTKARVSSANFIGTLRSYEEVAIGAYTNKSKFNKWASSLTNSDLEFHYIVLDADHANYSDIAAKYREYLMARDGIVANDTTDSTVVNLNFLGAFEKYALFLGFKYKKPDTLTTFDEATNIINELSTGIQVDGVNRKVNAFSVSYTGWTSEELQYQVGGGLSVSSKLGGKRGMQKFADTLNDMNISFYPEVFITTTQGYDLAYGNLKYTARSIANESAVVYQFDVATQRQNKKIAHTNMINPVYYNTITDMWIKKFNKLNISGDNVGANLVDLGNTTVGSYNKTSGVIYGQDAVTLQKQNLEKMKANGKVKIEAPYDYAFKYLDFATNIPLTSTKLAIFDETIPFYQLVVSGMFDYSTKEINGTSNYGANWYYARALETGSNLNFQISATNPTVLLDTDYTYYYQSFYDNWKESIVTVASKMDEAGIAKGTLVQHELLDKDISHVTYNLKDGSGTIELYVNATSKDYVYTDALANEYTIPAYGYVKLG